MKKLSTTQKKINWCKQILIDIKEAEWLHESIFLCNAVHKVSDTAACSKISPIFPEFVAAMKKVDTYDGSEYRDDEFSTVVWADFDYSSRRAFIKNLIKTLKAKE